MALKDGESVRQRLLRFIEKIDKRHGKIDVFNDIRDELEEKYPELFVDKLGIRKLQKNYSSAISCYRKGILKNNKTIKTKVDVLQPKIQKAIQDKLLNNPAQFQSGGKNKTIVLTLQDKDKVFFKMSDEVVKNLGETFKYWYAHNEVELYRSGAIRRRFTAEMIEEYYRIFSKLRNSKKSDEEKIAIYKELEKGIL